MRLIRLFLCIAPLLWLTPALALDQGEARHLLERAGFGARAEDIARLAPLSRAQAVASVMVGLGSAAVTPPPAFMQTRPDWETFYKTPEGAERRAFNKARDEESAILKAWWLREMIATPVPLNEQMTLFWHNIFTSSYDKVRQPDLLFRQNALFRAEAAGNFRRLVLEVARDPAMIRYLDTFTSRRRGPNENFARELMELFLLGEGAGYTEGDVREAARVFAGWRVAAKDGSFTIDRREVDPEKKQIFGQTVTSAEDLFQVLLAQPAASRLLATRLWQHFVSPVLDEAEISRLATMLVAGNWEIEPVLRALFLSPVFWDQANRGVIVKSPVDLMVGTIRRFDMPVNDPAPLVQALRRLGQDLFNPPNVKGWPGQSAWITTNTLLARQDVVMRLLRGGGSDGGMDGAGAGAGGWVAGHAVLADDPVALTRFVLALGPVGEVPDGITPLARIERLALDPVHQLR